MKFAPVLLFPTMLLPLAAGCATQSPGDATVAASPAPSSPIAVKGDLPVVAVTSTATTAPPATGQPPTITPGPPTPAPLTPSPPTPAPLTPGPSTPPATVVVVPVTPVATALLPTKQPFSPTKLPAIPTRLPPTSTATAVQTATARPITPGPTCTPGTTTPVIRDLYPKTGAAGTDITIIGSNLGTVNGSALVTFGSVVMVPWSITPGTISVIAPAGVTGTVPIRVWSTLGCGQATAQFTFPGGQPAPATTAAAAPVTNGPCNTNAATAPSVTGIGPRPFNVLGGDEVTISGRNLVSSRGPTVVIFGSTSATPTSATATTLKVIAPPGPVGPVVMKVATPEGCAQVSQSTLAYAVPRPTVVASSLSPKSGPIAGGTTVTINGRGLTGAVVKNSGGSPATMLSVTDSSVTFVTPSSRTVGNVSFSLTTPGGSTAFTFQYTR